MKKLIFTIFLALMSTAALAQIDVTFQVDMGVQVFRGNFDISTDVVVVRGSFQIDAGDTANWYGDMFELTDGDADTIYTGTWALPTDSAGKMYEYKFVISPDTWEANNRSFTLTAPGPQVLPVVWFNDDSLYQIGRTNTLSFTADISGILGVGAGGAFDPADDSLQVAGLDWDGLGENVVGNRTMVQDPFNPGIFTATLSVRSPVPPFPGDSTKWKFKAFPDARFSNNGYESGNDRFHFYQPDGSTITLPTIVPRLYPLFDTLQSDINVTFNVDMSDPVNRYNGEHIDPAILEFVGMRGGADFLGNWSSGNWLPSDTTLGYMKVLTNAGNNIWTRTVLLSGGTTPGGLYEYKFAMMYPGADTVNGGSSPLDNEGGFGENHNFLLYDGPDIVLDNVFGAFVSVEILEDMIPEQFSLEQNYPNPFNPTTTIRYSITEPGLINLKIFNLLGEEVMVLVNQEQVSGVYEVTLDASHFASGLYFYTLTNGTFSATKKMMLLK